MNLIIPTDCSGKPCAPLTLPADMADLMIEEVLDRYGPDEAVYDEPAVLEPNWNDAALASYRTQINDPATGEYFREVLTHHLERLINDQCTDIAVIAVFGMSPGELKVKRGISLASEPEVYLDNSEYTIVMRLAESIRPLREDGMCYGKCSETARRLYAEMPKGGK